MKGVTTTEPQVLKGSQSNTTNNCTQIWWARWNGPIHQKMQTFKCHCTDNKCWKSCEELGLFIHHWWECKMVKLFWKIAWKFYNGQAYDSPYDPCNSVPKYVYPREMKAYVHTDTWTWMLIAALFIIVLWTQPRCSSVDEVKCCLQWNIIQQ